MKCCGSFGGSGGAVFAGGILRGLFLPWRCPIGLSLLMNIPYIFDLNIIILAFVFSALVGVILAMFPHAAYQPSTPTLTLTLRGRYPECATIEQIPLPRVGLQVSRSMRAK